MKLGLVGQGIQQSRTPAMHRAEGAAQDLDLTYDLLDTDLMTPVPPLADILDRVEAEGYAGVNVTYPYKKEVMDHLDVLSDGARRVGAVNTVTFGEAGRTGHNTDYSGFAEGFRRGLPGADTACVLLLGAGGAGGAVGHALAAEGARRILIFDIAPEAAEALATDIGGPAEAVSDLVSAAREATGIVNATPMGMAKLPGTAIDTALIEPRHWVADIVYFPLETALLAAARAKGCATLSGAGMAVFQAVRAFELFTGREADPERMRATFESFDG